MTKKTIKKNRKQGKILGIGLNSTELVEVLAYVKYRIKIGRKFYLVTPNPEIILASTNDKVLKKVLKGADLALPDGIGLAQASRFLALSAPKNKILRSFVCVFQGLLVGAATFISKQSLPLRGKKWLTDSLNILPGRKVFLELISLANKNSWKVFLLGGYDGVSAKVSGKLAKKYKKVKFDFADGPKLGRDGEPDAEVDILIQKRCVEKINKFKPQLLFVALGPTKQEKWIAKNLSKLSVGGAMAVGGTFNYLAGVSKLPPQKIEEVGLEWFWRLTTEPWRLGRIFNAVIVFPLKVFLYKMSK